MSGVSLTVHEEECIFIRCEPGGADVLMQLTGGMVRPDTGEIFALGMAIHNLSAEEAAQYRSRYLGAVWDEPRLLPRLNVWENVALPLYSQYVSSAARRHAAMERLSSLGISYAAHALPSHLTVWEAQLACIARALIARPRLLLLAGIDTRLSEAETGRIWDIIHTARRKDGCAALCFSALESPAAQADRHIAFIHGTIREE